MHHKPAITAKFKPRADANLLAQLVTKAWNDYQESMFSAEERAAVGAGLADHLETLFPAADMAVLAKYGHTKTIEAIAVHMYTTDRWDEWVRVELARAVEIPTGADHLYQGGPRWSEHPTRGLTEAYRGRASPEELARIYADQEERDRARVPRALDFYFAKVLEARDAWRTERDQSAEWPNARKAEQGSYPTWAEIADRFPVLGAHIRKTLGVAAGA